MENGKRVNQSTMKIYVVSRMVTDEKWGRAVPNLSVRTSKKKILEDFNSIKEHRLNIGYKSLWQYYPENYKDVPSNRIVETYLESPDGSYENLYVEEWDR